MRERPQLGALLFAFSLLAMIAPLPPINSGVPSPQVHLLYPFPGNESLAGKFLPNGVNIYAAYQGEPAPMGISDYGISPSGPFVRETTQFLGEVNIYSLTASSSLNVPCITFQLNVMLNYQMGSSVYALWVQDVAFFNTQNQNVTIVDNIWNDSTYLGNVTGLTGNGNVCFESSTGRYFYYDVATGPGSGVPLSLPGVIYLLVNVSETSGKPVIHFWYNDGKGWVNYDNVIVNNALGATNVYFLVDGYRYAPSGNFYDAELVLGGPGGGSTAYISTGQVYLSLEYWNGHNFQGVRNAYNFGSDTAETAQGVQVSAVYYLRSGQLASSITSGFSSLGELWNQSQVSVLTVNAGVNQGYVEVYNSSYPLGNNPQYSFVGGSVTLTLEPMDYAVVVYNQSGVVGEANVPAGPGPVTTGVTRLGISGPMKLSMNSNRISFAVRINAYGPVSMEVRLPPGLTYTLSGPTTFSGDGNVTVTLSGNIPPGIYNLIVNATLFTGLSRLLNINLTVAPLVPINLTYVFLGNPPPTSPILTLYFPNGSQENLQLSNFTIKVPQGTRYAVTPTIQGSGVRWVTNDPVNGTVRGEAIVIKYYEQVLLNFDYQGELPPSITPSVIYRSFGVNETGQAPLSAWVDYGSEYVFTKYVVGHGVRWYSKNNTGIAVSPGTVVAIYLEQFLVSVSSPIPVHALINGVNETLVSGWYDRGTSIQVENLTYYPSTEVRDVITSISPTQFVLNSPVNLSVGVETQFLVSVSSPIPVHALINGVNETLVSGWYDRGTSIQVENLTYYPSTEVRDVIRSISPPSLTLNSPSTIEVKVETQFLVSVSSPIPVHALINGVNETLVSGWYDRGTSIQVENLTYYPSTEERDVIRSISPTQFVVNSPVNLSVGVETQFLVSVSSPIPVHALINGVNETLTTSWINRGSEISILNYTYYVNLSTRYIITNLTPSASFVLTAPVQIVLGVEKQFSVIVDGQLSWADSGQTLVLTANVPFFEIGKLVGTYNVSPGTTLVVSRPIDERLVLSPNYPVILGMTALVIASVATLVRLVRRPRG